jgi:hypothetical protein
MGAEVFPLIKQLGIGARGLDTPAEREFLRKVMTGMIPLNKETLLKMARDRRKASVGRMQEHDDRMDKGGMNSFYKIMGIPKEKFNVGWQLDQATAQQEDAAFAALGVSASDEDIDAWLIEQYGGGN